MRKMLKKWLVKIIKLKGTNSSIAAGVACGVAISFTPFVGLHLVLGFVTAWIVRGNLLASAIGTAIGNPWTFPFIWLSILYTGKKILGMEHEGVADVNFTKVFSSSFDALIHFDFEVFFRDVWPVIKPMAVGCIPYYVVSWALSYCLVKSWLDRRAGLKKARAK